MYVISIQLKKAIVAQIAFLIIAQLADLVKYFYLIWLIFEVCGSFLTSWIQLSQKNNELNLKSNFVSMSPHSNEMIIPEILNENLEVFGDLDNPVNNSTCFGCTSSSKEFFKCQKCQKVFCE